MFKTRCRRVIAIIAAVAVLLTVLCGAALVCYSHEQNKTFLVSSYTISHEQIPASFEGQRIVLLSDLHSKDFSDRLTQTVKEQDPDIIVVVGDWVDYRAKDIDIPTKQMKALTGIAPIYYVPGNHEIISNFHEEFFASLEEMGVTVLDNRAVEWTNGKESVRLIGVLDPEFGMNLRRDFAPNVKGEPYEILLSHRPEYFEEAAQYGADLMLSGHTHGGQIRLPFVGALLVSSQGLPPKYVVGRYDYQDSTMILTQGLGEGALMRILTPPEVVVITLDSPHT